MKLLLIFSQLILLVQQILARSYKPTRFFKPLTFLNVNKYAIEEGSTSRMLNERRSWQSRNNIESFANTVKTGEFDEQSNVSATSIDNDTIPPAVTVSDATTNNIEDSHAVLEPLVALSDFDDNILDENHKSDSLETEVSSNATVQSTEIIDNLLSKYKDKVVCCSNPHYPHCEIYLCGTLHVSQASVDMVKEAVSVIKPQFVAVELCEGRLDALVEYADSMRGRVVAKDEKNSIWKVLLDGFRQRSFKVLGMGLLSWMQNKTAAGLNCKLGAELSVAAQEGHKIGAAVVLADRRYDVTSQRIFDCLTTVDKLKMMAVLLWEALTTSLFHVRDYVAQSEDQSDFVAEEMQRFAEGMPHLARVIIDERDEYIAQTLCEIAKTGFGSHSVSGGAEANIIRKGLIVAVVGAGHLAGIQRHIQAGGISQERAQALGTSSDHQESTWPGEGRLRWVDTKKLFDDQEEVEKVEPSSTKSSAGAADIEECDY